jgi:hypothetical protein
MAYGLIHRALAASPTGLGQALGHAPVMPGGLWTGLSGVGACFAPLALLAILFLALLAAWLISGLGGSTRRAASPWLCGYAREMESNRYVAHGYYGEIKRYFRWLGGARVPEKPADLKGTLK